MGQNPREQRELLPVPSVSRCQAHFSSLSQVPLTEAVSAVLDILIGPELKAARAGSTAFQRVLLISFEDRLELKEAVEAYDIRCPMLWDRNHTYGGNLRVTTQPFNIIVDTSLTVVDIVAGPMSGEEYQKVLRGES